MHSFMRILQNTNLIPNLGIASSYLRSLMTHRSSVRFLLRLFSVMQASRNTSSFPHVLSLILGIGNKVLIYVCVTHIKLSSWQCVLSNIQLEVLRSCSLQFVFCKCDNKRKIQNNYLNFGVFPSKHIEMKIKQLTSLMRRANTTTKEMSSCLYPTFFNCQTLILHLEHSVVHRNSSFTLLFWLLKQVLKIQY